MNHVTPNQTERQMSTKLGFVSRRASEFTDEASVERKHAHLYPHGCPRGCESCAARGWHVSYDRKGRLIRMFVPVK